MELYNDKNLCDNPTIISNVIIDILINIINIRIM